MPGLRRWSTLLLVSGLILLAAGRVGRTEATPGVELSQDPLPEPGRLHAEHVRLYGIGLGDRKGTVLQAAHARRLVIDDEADIAFDIVYLYRDRIAVRTETNLAAYRIRGGAVEAISLFGRLPRTTATVPRFEALAPDALRELLQSCNEASVRERILGLPERGVRRGTPPEQIETYLYDGGRIELEYALYHYQNPRPSVSEVCRLTFQREPS